MRRCSCSKCRASGDPLRDLSADELAALDDRLRRLGHALKAGELTGEWEELDLGLDADDADVMSSIVSVFGSESARLAVRQRQGVEISEAELAEAKLRIAAQLDIGLALLSESARSRLSPVLTELNDLLAAEAGQARNAIQLGEELQRILTDVAIAGAGTTYDTSVYSPFEWSRLCRTEMVFARTAAEREVLQTEWDASPEALDQYGWPPIHPQCMCATGVWEDASGKFWIILEPTPTACEECNDAADAIAAHVGAM